MVSVPKAYFLSRLSNDSFQPQALNNWTSQNPPIPGQFIMVLRLKTADRYVARLVMMRVLILTSNSIGEDFYPFHLVPFIPL